jgi:hypothetical protein
MVFTDLFCSKDDVEEKKKSALQENGNPKSFDE